MKKTTVAISAFFLLSCSFFLFSCGNKKSAEFSARKDVEPLTCVILMPVEVQKNDDSADITDNLQAGAEFLERTIRQKLGESKVDRVIESSQFHPQISAVSHGKLGAIKEIGVQGHCDAVLMTTLSTYRQRQGGSLAVDAPASASFEMQLIRASTGARLWSSAFNETQTSLVENLFSFGKARRRGFKWITVEELVSQGVHENIAGCPYFNQ